MVCLAWVRSKLKYSSAAWNSLTIAYCHTLKSIRRQYAALFLRFYQAIRYHYVDLLEKLNLRTLHTCITRRRPNDYIFLYISTALWTLAAFSVS
jgi:hypothetical protein